MRTWIRRQRDSELAAMLEPWHLVTQAPAGGVIVAECGKSFTDDKDTERRRDGWLLTTVERCAVCHEASVQSWGAR